jgi:hypothetical protein
MKLEAVTLEKIKNRITVSKCSRTSLGMVPAVLTHPVPLSPDPDKHIFKLLTNLRLYLNNVDVLFEFKKFPISDHRILILIQNIITKSA